MHKIHELAADILGGMTSYWLIISKLSNLILLTCLTNISVYHSLKHNIEVECRDINWVHLKWKNVCQDYLICTRQWPLAIPVFQERRA